MLPSSSKQAKPAREVAQRRRHQIFFFIKTVPFRHKRISLLLLFLVVRSCREINIVLLYLLTLPSCNKILCSAVPSRRESLHPYEIYRAAPLKNGAPTVPSRPVPPTEGALLTLSGPQSRFGGKLLGFGGKLLGLGDKLLEI